MTDEERAAELKLIDTMINMYRKDIWKSHQAIESWMEERRKWESKTRD